MKFFILEVLITKSILMISSPSGHRKANSSHLSQSSWEFIFQQLRQGKK